MTRSVKIIYGRILMARLPLTSTISAELNLGIRIKKYSFFCLLTIFCQIWFPPYEQQGTSGSPWKDCQHCADLWSKKSRNGDTLGPVELIVLPEQGNQGDWREQDG